MTTRKKQAAFKAKTKATGFQSFRNFVPKRDLTRYGGQNTGFLVNGALAEGAAAEIDEEIRALCEALVASEGGLGP